MRKIWLDGLNWASLGTGAWKYFLSAWSSVPSRPPVWLFLVESTAPGSSLLSSKYSSPAAVTAKRNHVFRHKTSIFSTSLIKRNLKPCCLRKSARYFRICTRKFSPLKRLLDNFSCQRIAVDCPDNFTSAGKVLKARIQSFICFVKLNSVANWEILVEWRWA